MKNKLLILILILFSSCNLYSQNNEWVQSSLPYMESKVSSMNENIRYTVDSTMSIAVRDELIRKTKQYIKDNLVMISESELKDSIHIIIVKDRDEMTKYIGAPYSGMTYSVKDEYVTEYMIFCIYETKYEPLKHELMHMISILKWGRTNCGDWLLEGIANLGRPENSKL